MILDKIKYTETGSPYRERLRYNKVVKEYGIIFKCPTCKSNAFVDKGNSTRSKKSFCSQECYHKGHKMENAYQWKGGHYKNDSGYVLKYAPDHPKARQDGYILEHRLIIERERPLICEICNSTNNMHIHHKDQNKSNNLVDNLSVLCASCHIHVTMLLKLNKSPNKNKILQFIKAT